MNRKDFYLGIDDWQQFPQVVYTMKDIPIDEVADIAEMITLSGYRIIAFRRYQGSIMYELSQSIKDISRFDYSYMFYHQCKNKNGNDDIIIRIYNINNNVYDTESWQELISPENINPLNKVSSEVPLNFEEIVW